MYAYTYRHTIEEQVILLQEEVDLPFEVSMHVYIQNVEKDGIRARRSVYLLRLVFSFFFTVNVHTIHPYPQAGQRCRYFVIKSLNHKNLVISVQKKRWTTHRSHMELLNKAYQTSDKVSVIIISITMIIIITSIIMKSQRKTCN